MSQPVLELSGLARSYGTGELRKEVIADLNLTVHQGEFVCIVGPSGAGKTTLLKCIAGLLPPSSGRVMLEGEEVVSPPKQLALVFQDYSRSLLPWMSVRKNVELPLQGRVNRESIRRRSNAALEEVGLISVVDKYPWQLSGGMQQRAAIARAVAYEADLLLMDEPFAAVDAQTRFDLEDLMVRIQNEHGVTIVFVTHDIDEAVYLGSRVAVLSGSPAHVQRDLPVRLTRPRDQSATKAHPDFVRLRTEVLDLIRHAER